MLYATSSNWPSGEAWPPGTRELIHWRIDMWSSAKPAAVKLLYVVG